MMKQQTCAGLCLNYLLGVHHEPHAGMEGDARCQFNGAQQHQPSQEAGGRYKAEVECCTIAKNCHLENINSER